MGIFLKLKQGIRKEKEKRPKKAFISNCKYTKKLQPYAVADSISDGAVGETVNVYGYLTNLFGNKWYMLDDGYVYSGELNDTTYTISFNANGGSCSPADKKVTYNSTYGTLPTPVLTGYTFDGWYTSLEDGTKITADTKVTITNNQTLYAHWKHTHSYVSKTTEPTCTKQGYTTYTCSCGDSYVSDYVKPTGHNYISEITTPATCTDDGVRTFTCLCGDTYTEAITATGHELDDWKQTVEPTTTTRGVIRRQCKHCDYFEEIIMGYADVDRVKGVTISSQSEVIKLGESVTLTATVIPETAGDKTVTWSSYDTTVASVENGVVTANGVGSTVIIVQTNDGGYKDLCLVKVAGITASASTNSVVDSEKGLIYGLAPNLDNFDGFVDVAADGLTLECNSEKLGTGSVVNIVKDGIVVDSYEIVIIGDATGDSVYDGMDAVIVQCIAA